MKRNIKSALKKFLLKFGYHIERVTPDIDRPLRLWDADERFNKIYEQIVDNTIVDKVRCFIIYQYAKQLISIPGDVAEVGVYKGGTAKLLAKTFESSPKTIYLFDTFKGLPYSDPQKDLYKKGDFSGITFEGVKTYLKDLKNIEIYPGLFPESVPDFLKNKKFCMVHIDVDVYKSAMEAAEFFYPRLEKSGIMIFDDYGFPLCPGAKRAVDDFLSKKPENLLYLPTGQCVVCKR